MLNVKKIGRLKLFPITTVSWRWMKKVRKHAKYGRIFNFDHWIFLLLRPTANRLSLQILDIRKKLWNFLTVSDLFVEFCPIGTKWYIVLLWLSQILNWILFVLNNIIRNVTRSNSPENAMIRHILLQRDWGILDFRLDDCFSVCVTSCSRLFHE